MHHRIYLPNIPATGDVTVEGAELHHALRVVRVRIGEPVELFDGKGHAASGTVVETNPLRVAIEREIPSREAKTRIHLAMAIIHLDKFELVLQKATELGVASIIPLVTERVEIRPERYRGKGERWEKIVFEAVKQSGRSMIPTVAEPQPLAAVIPRGGIMFDADEEPSGANPGSETTLFIGPEGGWTPAEISAARTAGCHFRRLGNRRLRAETAAILAVGITAAVAGDI